MDIMILSTHKTTNYIPTSNVVLICEIWCAIIHSGKKFLLCNNHLCDNQWKYWWLYKNNIHKDSIAVWNSGCLVHYI